MQEIKPIHIRFKEEDRHYYETFNQLCDDKGSSKNEFGAQIIKHFIDELGLGDESSKQNTDGNHALLDKLVNEITSLKSQINSLNKKTTQSTSWIKSMLLAKHTLDGYTGSKLIELFDQANNLQEAMELSSNSDLNLCKRMIEEA